MIKVKLAMLLLFVTCTACSRLPTLKSGHYVKVEQKNINTELFYTGMIQPINTYVITSPADGIITKQSCQYGDAVKPGDVLFEISSPQFLSDYKNALIAYIKAKSDYAASNHQWTEAKFLLTHTLISQDDFKAKQDAYYSNQLVLLQAKNKLDNFVRLLGKNDSTLYDLSISDVDKITPIIRNDNHDEVIAITSKAPGILLSPVKNDNEIKRREKGDIVKLGEAFAVVGDMSGILVRFKVSELIVNQLNTGQSAVITGAAFPNENLIGKINRIDRQGEAANGDNPTFTVDVIVPKLTPMAQHAIRVGMSVSIQLNIQKESQIMVPINAVKEKNGQSFVTIYDMSKRKFCDVIVTTGETTQDSVVLMSGLKPGDPLVVPN